MGSRHRSTAVVCVVVVLAAGCLGGAPADDPVGTQSGTESRQSTAAATGGTVEVHFINVGQSVSTLVVGPTGETMLVDTGHYSDDGEYVLEYLRRHGVSRIDHLVVSHNDADHIGGNAAVIDYFESSAGGVGAVYDPGIAASTRTYERYLDAVERHDVTLFEVREGDQIPFEGVAVDALGPPDPYLADGARNENSVVLKLGYGETSFLLPGDAEDDQEAYLVDEYGDALNATVLKAGHHGAASSSSGAFLDAVRPQAVVVSSAYDSQYGHPAEAVLDRLADRSIPTLWTATHGDVVIVSDGEAVSVRTQADAPTAPAALRDGDPVAPGTAGPVEERLRLEGGSATTVSEPLTTDGGTTTESALSVASIHADAAGDDRENLDDEYVVFENTGSSPLDLGGWTVRDEAGHTYTFPDGVTLDAGDRVTLHTGSGEDTATDLYWGSDAPIWNNDGDTVIVRDANGDRVLAESYR